MVVCSDEPGRTGTIRPGRTASVAPVAGPAGGIAMGETAQDSLPDLFGPDGVPHTDAALTATQDAWRRAFAETLYGPVPPRPRGVSVARGPLAEGAEHLSITVEAGAQRHCVDAALWLPRGRGGPVPIVVALAFLGPAGVLFGDDFPLDRDALVDCEPALGLCDRRLADHVRGAHAARWPVPLFAAHGVGLLLACYGSFVPDCPERWRRKGLLPLLGLDGAAAGAVPGAISLWAFALSRLLDAALSLPEVDPERVAVAGHSRLGKAALWAAANDARIASAFVNDAGCAGSALESRTRGERIADLAARFPHWVLPGAGRPRDTAGSTLDQHHLIACVAPRRVHIGASAADDWADPVAQYLGLRAATPSWGVGRPGLSLPPASSLFGKGGLRACDAASVVDGPLSYHVRPGGHGLTPEDWRQFLRTLAV